MVNRNDGIEAVESHRLVRLGNVQILHIAFVSQFPLREHIPQVPGRQPLPIVVLGLAAAAATKSAVPFPTESAATLADSEHAGDRRALRTAA